MGSAIADADVVMGALKLELSGQHQVEGQPKTQRLGVASAPSFAPTPLPFGSPSRRGSQTGAAAGAGLAIPRFETLLGQLSLRVVQAEVRMDELERVGPLWRRLDAVRVAVEALGAGRAFDEASAAHEVRMGSLRGGGGGPCAHARGEQEEREGAATLLVAPVRLRPVPACGCGHARVGEGGRGQM